MHTFFSSYTSTFSLSVIQPTNTNTLHLPPSPASLDMVRFHLHHLHHLQQLSIYRLRALCYSHAYFSPILHILHTFSTQSPHSLHGLHAEQESLWEVLPDLIVLLSYVSIRDGVRIKNCYWKSRECHFFGRGCFRARSGERRLRLPATVAGLPKQRFLPER